MAGMYPENEEVTIFGEKVQAQAAENVSQQAQRNSRLHEILLTQNSRQMSSYCSANTK